VVLAVLLTALYAYWYLTNDARIAAQAERYLRQITGCDVKIRSATFRLFGGIELDDVRVRIPGDDSHEPFFQARQLAGAAARMTTHCSRPKSDDADAWRMGLVARYLRCSDQRTQSRNSWPPSRNGSSSSKRATGPRPP